MNVPNVLSLLRLLLTPVFVGVFFSDMEGAWYIAGAIFIIAEITDVLDGYIARKYNIITKLGRVLDPLADKLIKAAAAACLVIAGVIPVYVVVILVCKELIMLLGAVIFYRRMKDVPSSNKFGKGVEFFMCALIIAHIFLPIPQSVSNILWPCALIAEFAALAIYIAGAYRNINQAKEEPNEN